MVTRQLAGMQPVEQAVSHAEVSCQSCKVHETHTRHYKPCPTGHYTTHTSVTRSHTQPANRHRSASRTEKPTLFGIVHRRRRMPLRPRRPRRAAGAAAARRRRPPRAARRRRRRLLAAARRAAAGGRRRDELHPTAKGHPHVGFVAVTPVLGAVDVLFWRCVVCVVLCVRVCMGCVYDARQPKQNPPDPRFVIRSPPRPPTLWCATVLPCRAAALLAGFSSTCATVWYCRMTALGFCFCFLGGGALFRGCGYVCVSCDLCVVTTDGVVMTAGGSCLLLTP
jgi:hypothetical protein